jgi:hypothetical protein
MTRSKVELKKHKPAGKPVDLALRLPAELADRIDVWAIAHDAGAPADAVRRLIELGLAAKVRHAASARQRDRAASLAAQQIDQMADASATVQDRADRKQRLTEGPSMFRAVRRDRSKKMEAK